MNKQVLLVGFTLVGGALGFWIEEKVEAHYKEKRFNQFEAAVLARRTGGVTGQPVVGKK